ncbi:MAG: signal peptidase [Solirubrobacteraceae bacterium]|jgi:signal peptidase II|nr:signal peptidase [Solirubrobacteraceae bacterium]
MALGAWGRVALVAAGVVALDQATKALVRATVARGESEAVLPGVEIVHTRNTGVAFGALAGGGAIVTVVIGLALVALLGYFGTHVRRPLVWLPTGMLLGGAIGNVIDRVRDGAVTDFVQLPLGFPPFNVADMSITFGVLVLLYVLERHDGASRRA